MGTADLLVDTHVLVDHLRGKRRLTWDSGALALSVVTRCGLVAGSDVPERLRHLLSAMTELPVDTKVAELAGLTRRRTGIAIPDALTAATPSRTGSRS